MELVPCHHKLTRPLYTPKYHRQDVPKVPQLQDPVVNEEMLDVSSARILKFAILPWSRKEMASSPIVL